MKPDTLSLHFRLGYHSIDKNVFSLDFYTVLCCKSLLLDLDDQFSHKDPHDAYFFL